MEAPRTFDAKARVRIPYAPMDVGPTAGPSGSSPTSRDSNAGVGPPLPAKETALPRSATRGSTPLLSVTWSVKQRSALPPSRKRMGLSGLGIVPSALRFATASRGISAQAVSAAQRTNVLPHGRAWHCLHVGDRRRQRERPRLSRPAGDGVGDRREFRVALRTAGDAAASCLMMTMNGLAGGALLTRT